MRHSGSERDRREGSRRRRGWRRADLTLAIPFLVAAVWALLGHRPAALITSVVGGTLLGARVVLGDGLHRGVAAVGRAAERALTTMAVTGVWLVVALPAAAVSRITGHDPARGARAGWQIHHRSTPARRSFGITPVTTHRPLRAIAVVGALAALALAPAAGERAEPPPTLAGDTWWAPGFAGQPLGRAVWEEHRTLPSPDSDAQLGWRNADTDLPLTQVEDLARRTWLGPDGETAPTVWIFGGSTVFGMGQRDDHTIASELVRTAQADGHPLAVTNYGVVGYVAWQEVGLFERLLRDRPAPDVAVFYHRSNDLAVACNRIAAGLALNEPLTLSELSPLHPLPFAPPVRDGQTCEREPDLAAESLARDMGRPMAEARRLAAAHDIVVLDVWQPDMWTIAAESSTRFFAERVGGEPQFRAARQTVLQRAFDLLTPAPIDLGHALDDAEGETLFDVVHHNEEGSRQVAHHLWPHVRDALPEGTS